MSKDYDKQKILEIYNKAVKAINKTIREIINYNEDKYKINNKGGIGNLIQEYYFGIPANSRQEPDFADLNLELKVMPLKKVISDRGKDKYVAKERVVFNLINYNDIVNEQSLENSTFISKNRIILLMTYIHNYETKNKLDYKINGVYLLDLKNLKEYEIIKNEWSFIVDTIREGKADTLSERSTLVLKACTKGNKDQILTTQPFSEQKAKRRAFSFSATFMNEIIDRLENDKNYIFNILTDNERKYLKYIKEEELVKYMNSLIGINLINYKNSDSKQWRRMAFDNYLNQNNKGILEFIKSSEYILSVINSKNKIPNEELKTKCLLDPIEIINEEFEDSTLYQYIILKTFLIVLVSKESNIIEEIKMFKFSNKELEDTKWVYEKTKDELKRIEKLNTNERILPNFIKVSDNKTIHIRPNARNGKDTYKNNKFNITKQVFWVNIKHRFKNKT